MVYFGGHKKRHIYRFFCALISIFILLLTPFSTSALSHFDHIVFKENNILFYNPDEKCDNLSVAIYGDSLSVQMQDAGKFSEAFPNAAVDAIWGRPWVSNTAKYDELPSGLDSLKQNGVSSDAIIWLLGQNNRAHQSSNWFSDLTEADITALRETAGESTPIFVMTGFDDANHSVFDNNNALIRAAVEQYDNWFLLDWATLGASNPNYTVTLPDDYNDDVYGTFKMHLSDEGMDAFIEMIKTALEESKDLLCSSRRRDNAKDPCSDFTSTKDNKNDHWDGSCSSVSSYEAWLNKHINTIMNIASKNGIPWEALMAQTIQESGGGSKEVCSFNPLGLKSAGGQPYCDDRKHAQFSSYDEAFQYYVDHIIPVREAKNRFANDPYSYIDFIQHGASSHYAAATDYVQKVSSLVCGIQKWAEAHGYSTSSASYKNKTSTNSSKGFNNCILSSGGLTEEQARQFVINYGANKNNIPQNSMPQSLWNACGGPFGSNCVSFAAFFLNAFTGTPFNHGNGYQVVGNLNTAKGATPSVFSIVSSGKYGDNGHVAVVLGIEDGKYIIGHASCSRGNSGKRGAGNGTQEGSGSAFIKIETSSDPSNWWGMNGTTPTFAYPSGINEAAIMEFAQ